MYDTPWKVNKDILATIDRKATVAPIPFGYDAFDCYHLSAMRIDKIPVNGIVRICYQHNTSKMLCSNALDYYLNSYNRLSMGCSDFEVLKNLESCIKFDLTQLMAGPTIDVKVHHLDHPSMKPINYVDSIYKHLESTTLRSCTPISGEPFWGDVHVVTDNHSLNDLDLWHYLNRFRYQTLYEEDVCDFIYTDYTNFSNELMVVCLYTRRDGININVVRSSSEELIRRYVNFNDLDFLTIKTSRQ